MNDEELKKINNNSEEQTLCLFFAFIGGFMNLDKFIPTIYKKNVLNIDYIKLKKDGIKCILFDLDNTLINVKENFFDKKTEKLLMKLYKDFKLIIV